MDTIKKSYDLNAHIKNLRGTVNTKNGKRALYIDFDNLAKDKIVSIKFSAKAYDHNDNLMYINGSDVFYIILNSISVDKNVRARSLQAELPDDNIMRVELLEEQVCFSDGAIYNYKGENIITLDVELFDSIDELEAVQAVFDKNAKHKYHEFDGGWICCCGRLNKTSVVNCTRCGKSKSEVIYISTSMGIKEIVKQYKKNIDDENLLAIEEDKAEKVKRNRKIALIISLFFVVLAISALIVHFKEIREATSFKNDEEMKNAIEGVYIYYDKSKAVEQIKVYGDKIIIRDIDKGSSSDEEVLIEDFVPKIAEFVTEDKTKYIYNKNNEIKDPEDRVFVKVGEWNEQFVGKPEDGFEVLQITGVYVVKSGEQSIVSGIIKNNGLNFYQNVKIQGDFYDKDGNLVYSNSSYAVGAEGLSPGEDMSFKEIIPIDADISKCTVKVIEFE